MKNLSKKYGLCIALVACILPACVKKPAVVTQPQVVTGPTVRDTDGNVYHTITIGSQVWMVENLKTTHYRDGTPIVNASDSSSWVNNTDGAYCDYNNTLSNSSIYGRLYNWYAATNSHNICPKGWHVPSEAEWSTLFTYLGGVSVAGGKLKETGTAHWTNPNAGATNESGFSALPGGFRSGNGKLFSGKFFSLGQYGVWWSQTEQNTGNAWDFNITYTISYIESNDNAESDGYSVRCVKD